MLPAAWTVTRITTQVAHNAIKTEQCRLRPTAGNVVPAGYGINKTGTTMKPSPVRVVVVEWHVAGAIPAGERFVRNKGCLDDCT